MKKKLIFSVILLIVMILSSSFVAYAYFTTVFDNSVSSKYEVKSAELPTVYIESYNNFELEILASDMYEENASSLEPTVTTGLVDGFNITVKNTSSGGSSTINYKIYYEPTIAYIKSSENINNEKEFVISVISDVSGLIVEKFSLNDISSKVLLYEGTINASGINKTASENFSIELSFYNQEFIQDDNAGKTFTGKIIIESEDIIYER